MANVTETDLEEVKAGVMDRVLDLVNQSDFMDIIWQLDPELHARYDIMTVKLKHNIDPTDEEYNTVNELICLWQKTLLELVVKQF